MTSRVIVFGAAGTCNEDFVELLGESAASTCWGRRGMARRLLRLLRGHGVG